MNIRSVSLPDGRYFISYQFSGPNWAALSGDNPNPLHSPQIGDTGSELRWNPLLGEWVINAAHRQNRTFLPPPGSCPFCPGSGARRGDVPVETYDLAVLENRFPSLQPSPAKPFISGDPFFETGPAQGVCEVVLYTPDHQTSLAQTSVEQIYKLVLVWTSRYHELCKLPFVKYVFIFENKGEAIGVTLHHPHGQIYAYSFRPPRIERELEQCRIHHQETGSCLLCSVLRHEVNDGRRLVTANTSFTAIIPFYARWPYEVHLISNRHMQSLDDFTPDEQRDLASILKAVLVAYDRIFSLSFPYMMVIHQKPSDGEAYDFYHFHIEFYPPMRAANRLKYLAGSETGAGIFINDAQPEAKAAELRSLVQPVVWREGAA